MSLFINTDTMEYPRYEGDIANEPNANWAEVERATVPEYAVDQAPYELTPILVNNTWTQQWAVRNLTTEEIENNKALHLEYLQKLRMPHPPTPMPTEGEWYWDEDSLSWIESTIP